MKKKKTEEKISPSEFDQALTESKGSKYVLRLYLTGTTSKSVLALANLKKICEEYLEGQYELEVIDLYQMPGLAKDDQIIASPTLIKKLPLPFRRIVGDMSNVEKVLMGLELKKVNDF